MNKHVDEYLILYFDILGYKQMLKEFRSQDEYLKLIDGGLNYTDKITRSYKNLKLKKIVFSDNVLIAIKLKDCNSEVIFEFLKMTCFIQNYFIMHSTFIRGSIIIGKLYFSRKPTYIFGQGIVDAFYMENNEAIYPRILISDECIKYFIDNDIDKHIFTKDFDNKYILNNFYTIGMFLVEPTIDCKFKYELLDQIYNIKSIIINMISVFKGDIKITEKYKWTAKHYNRFLRMINLHSVTEFRILFINEELL